MDHLPKPDSPEYEIKIPYICQTAYDQLDFETYPARAGWNVSKLLDADFEKHSHDEFAPFVQTWLYFGVVSSFLEIVGLPFDQRQYVHELPVGELTVTSAPLHNHILTWQAGVSSQTLTERRHQGQRIRTMLERASLYTNSMLTRILPGSLLEFVPPEVTLSILVLGSSLFRAATRICKDSIPTHYANNLLGGEMSADIQETDEDPGGADTSSWSEPYWGFSQLSKAKLLEQKWCIRDITMLQDLFSADSIHYVSELGINRIADHSNCTSDKCIGNQVDDKRYKTKHVRIGCDCKLVSIDERQVISILKNGGIPVVSLSQDFLNNGKDLPVSQSDRFCPYIALSHVWVHGLGNVEANALQHCQMARLLTYLQLLSVGNSMDSSQSTVLFWIDTLCVPVRDNEARKAAIRRMKQTYEDAESVLVLDQDIHQLPVPTTLEETSMRLACSDWMRRLWTLQEAVFARRLLVQFQDGWVDLTSENARDRGKPSVFDNIRKDSIQLFLDIELLQSEIWRTSDEVNSLVPIFNALRYRSTSKSGDEAICIAPFLGIHTDPIVERLPEDRMNFLLSNISRVSPHILFLSGTKLQDQGFRWAPQSFLNRNTSTDTYELMAGSPVPRSSEGLEVQFPGFYIKYASDCLASTFYFADRSDRAWYKFESVRDVFPECIDEPDWDTALASLQNLAVVMPRTLTESDEGQTIVCGLLSSSCNNGQGVISGRFESRAFVTRMVQTTIPFTDLYQILQDEDNALSGSMAIAEKIAVDQKWCIC